MTIAYSYQGKNENMIAAVALCDRVMGSKDYWARISARTELFFNTRRSVSDVVGCVRQAWGTACAVCEWTPPWHSAAIYRNTVAFVSNGQADTLFYHVKFLGNSVEAMVNTLAHEFVHIADRFHDESTEWDFTHAGQYSHKPPENQESAPYFIGNEAEREAVTLARGGQKAVMPFSPTEFACGTGDATPPIE